MGVRCVVCCVFLQQLAVQMGSWYDLILILMRYKSRCTVLKVCWQGLFLQSSVRLEVQTVINRLWQIKHWLL